MRWIWGCAVFAAASVLGGLGAAGAAPLEVYGRLPTLDHVEISPDGANLAFVITTPEAHRVVIESIADRKLLGGVNLGDAKLRWLDWADSQHLLVTTSMTGLAAGVESSRQEWYLAQVFDLASKRSRALMEGAENAMNVVTSRPAVRRIDGRAYVYFQGISFVDNQGVQTLFRTDLGTGVEKTVQTGDQRTRNYLVDAKGQVAAEARYAEASGRWTLRVHSTATGWMDSRTIVAPISPPVIEGLGRDGRSVLVALSEDDRWMAHEVSLADGAWGPAIDDPYSGLIKDPATHAWIGGEDLDGDDLRYDFFDPATAKLWAATTRAYAGQRVSFASWSADRQRWVVLVDSPTEGPAYALVDLATRHADWIGDEYANLKPADISPVTPVRYKAADGLEITGYLTLPQGRPAKNLPLVVLPHGGPASRDEPGFDWWAQAVASRGYAVLQPNFRGSSGFTTPFLAAGYGEWGRKMQTDLSDGARWLAGRGTIDPKRVCIFGASYGGYAALAGATIDTGVYRCAVSVAGPADLRRMLRDEQSDQQWSNNETLRYWDRFMGAKGVNDPALDAISPAQLAAKATIPILLIHGKDDTVVPYAQSQIMADALKRAGKPVTFVTLKGEDHWLSRGETRLQMLTAAMAFIEANNPPN